MKKTICFILCLILTCPVCIHGESDQLTEHASSSVLMDYESREVLYEKQMHEKLYPASMTKMMSLYLVIKAIHQGSFGWDDIVSVSEHASSMGGSQIYLEAGEKMSVLDLFKASTVASANDAIMALAEKVSGSESAFVDLMNQTAQSFGCMDTHFVNPTGLHDVNHVSSAYDMALIACHLIEEGQEELLKYTSLLEDYIREDTDHRFWLVNTNKMLRSYPGMDGLKTGYTSESMYCITVTAKRDGLRLVGVVMHEPDKKTRSKEAAALLDHGFANFRWKEVLKEQEINEIIRIDKGMPETIHVTNQKALGLTALQHEDVSVISRSIVLSELSAPIQKGQSVGQMNLVLSNGRILSTDLVAMESSEQMSVMNIFMDCLKKVIF